MTAKTSREKFEEARHQLVARDNDLIQKGRYGLSLVQQKCVLYCISKVKPTDNPDTEYEIDLREFYRLMGYKSDSYSGIKALWQQIGSVRWWLDGQTEDDDDILLGWFNKVHLNERSASVSITFHPDIYPYIHNLVTDKEKKRYFTTYQLQNITLMKHRYSIRIYDLLKSYQYNNKIWQFELGTGSHHDLMRRISDCDEKGKPLIPKSWDNYSFFNRDVLQPAVEEINQYTDIKIAYEVTKTDLSGKKHRKYVSILFAMVEKSPAEKLASQEHIQQALNMPPEDDEEEIADLFSNFFAQHEAKLKEEGVYEQEDPDSKSIIYEQENPNSKAIIYEQENLDRKASVLPVQKPDESAKEITNTTVRPEVQTSKKQKKVSEVCGTNSQNGMDSQNGTDFQNGTNSRNGTDSRNKGTTSQTQDVDIFMVCSKAASLLKPLGLNPSEILILVQTASYDLEKIQTAYEVLKESKGKIYDVVPWLISAVKNGYQPRKAVPYQGVKKNSFTDYEQRNYDYDDLMNKVRNAQEWKFQIKED